MTVRYSGLKELSRDLQRAGIDVADLRKAFGGISREGRALARQFAPRRSGRLAASIRANTGKNYAAVSAGNRNVRYAGVLNYGWQRRNITATGFMQRADAAMRPRALRDLVAAVDRLIREANLS